MTQRLTKAQIDRLVPRIDSNSGKKKARDVFDGGGAGLLVRVQPSGRKYYYVQFRRPAHVKKRKTGETRFEINTTRVRIGRTDHMGLNRARDLAKEASSAARSAVTAGLSGDDVRQIVNQRLLGLDKTPAELSRESEKRRECPTVLEFIDNSYGPYKQGQNKYCEDGREIVRLKHVMEVLSKDSRKGPSDGRKGDQKLNLLVKKLYEIDGNLIRRWLTRRLKRVSDRTGAVPSKVTIQRELNMMRAMFKHATLEIECIESNPLDGITLKAKSKRKVFPLQPEEEDRLLGTLISREEKLREQGEAKFATGEFADFLRPIILLAMHTGMRFGELASLRWDDVEMQTDKNSSPHNQITLLETKGGEPLEIPLNDYAVSVLRKWRSQCATLMLAGSRMNELVFQDRNGNALKEIRRFWLPVFCEAGLPKGYRFHDLRHHFASRLVMSGVPLFAVQSLLNHSSPEMTQRYAKFSPDWMQQTVGKLSEDKKWTL